MINPRSLHFLKSKWVLFYHYEFLPRFRQIQDLAMKWIRNAYEPVELDNLRTHQTPLLLHRIRLASLLENLKVSISKHANEQPDLIEIEQKAIIISILAIRLTKLLHLFIFFVLFLAVTCVTELLLFVFVVFFAAIH